MVYQYHKHGHACHTPGSKTGALVVATESAENFCDVYDVDEAGCATSSRAKGARFNSDTSDKWFATYQNDEAKGTTDNLFSEDK